MTGKIDRQVIGPRPKTESIARAEAPQKSAAVSSSSAPATQWTTGRASGPALAGIGKGHVARSAQPDALWGDTAPKGTDDRVAISNLSPADRHTKLTELRGRRDALKAEVAERVAQLDKKWEKVPTAIKADALSQYTAVSEHLDSQTRTELKGLVDAAQGCQAEINRLRLNREGLPPSRNATPETKAARNALAAELRAARSQQYAAVKGATAVIDDQGLKVDRLAATEQIIDPSAPKASDPTSLASKVKQFISLSSLISWLATLISESELDISQRKGRERDEVLNKDLQNQQVQQRLVASRKAIKELAALRTRDS